MIIVFLIGSNSSVLFSNTSNPTGSNGIGTQLIPTNVTTNTTSRTVVINSSQAPTTHGMTESTEKPTEAGIDLEGRKSATGTTTSAFPAEGENGGQAKEPNSTEPFVIGNGTGNKGNKNLGKQKLNCLATGS